jgi:hypothetical protein
MPAMDDSRRHNIRGYLTVLSFPALYEELSIQGCFLFVLWVLISDL